MAKKTTTTKPPKNESLILDQDDSEKGRWGGISEREGRRLSAFLTSVEVDGFWFHLQVSSTDGSTLNGPVVFHLDDSFPKPVQHITKIREGNRVIWEDIYSTGAFTVGAQIQNAIGEWVRLEYTLEQLPGLPKRFGGPGVRSPRTADKALPPLIGLTRPVLTVIGDDVDPDEAGGAWGDRLRKPNVREALRSVLRAVGRIEVDNHPKTAYLGGGWLVASGILATAGFVAREFAVRHEEKFVFRPGMPNPWDRMAVRVDFKGEVVGGKPRPFAVTEVLHLDEVADVALLRVEPTGPYGTLSPPLRLADRPPEGGQLIGTISYPAKDNRLSPSVFESVFGGVAEVKRLSVGEVLAVEGGKLRHDCVTAPGSAGAPIVDLLTGDVVGLHIGGDPLGEKNGVTAPVIAEVLERFRGIKTRSTPPAVVEAQVASLQASPAPTTPGDSRKESTQRLISALVSAFSFTDLQKLASLELKVDLNQLAPRGSTEEAAKALVQWAEQSEQRTRDLVAALLASRRDSPQIVALAPASAPAPPVDPGEAAHKMRQRLRGLLLDQFPRRSDLSMLLDDATGEDLNSVAGEGQNALDVCYALVRWLWIDHAGRLRPFLREAVALRPNSVELQRFLSGLE